VAPDLDDWTGYEAAHIFPLKKEDIWNEGNFSHWTTKATTGYSPPINSIQNGILLTGLMHDAFVKYLVSVSPHVSDFTVCRAINLLLICLQDAYKIITLVMITLMSTAER
jgi:hypothetical protein